MGKLCLVSCFAEHHTAADVPRGGAIFRVMILSRSSRCTPLIWTMITYHQFQLQAFQPFRTHLDGSQHHRSVIMLELRHDPLANLLALLGVYRLVRRESIEDRYSSPFRAFVQRHE